jgi:protein SCO1/2
MVVFTAFLIAALCPFDSYGSNDRYGITEKIGARLPAEVILLNEDSVNVRFGDLIDKPTLLSFVYYKCPGLCSPLMDGIAEIMDKTDLIAGKDYQVITISIDDNESLRLAKAKKAAYLATMKNVQAAGCWKFYKADSSAIRILTNAAGWGFTRHGKDFAHVAATILLTPDRRINQYFYGTFIMPMHFHMAVTEAGEGKTGVSRIKEQKYCYNFTPARNLPFSFTILTSGTLIIILATGLFIWLYLNARAKGKFNQRA